jgi:PHP family Zn ribbon phosphoesterase
MVAIILVDGDFTLPYEYFCKACLQLRISCVVSSKCANCGSSNIIKGVCGSLNVEELTKDAKEEL